jgi:SAM-dependent methyltransferase
MTCNVCGGALQSILALPDVDILSCATCGHQQSQLKTQAIEYSDTYVLERHKNWLAHPNFALYARITRELKKSGAGSRVLDAACGDGNFLRFLAKEGAGTDFTGLDQAAVASGEGITFKQGDFLQYTPEHPFDVVTSMAAIEHFTDVRAFAQQTARCVKPGGLAVIMTVDCDSFLYSTARRLYALGLQRPAQQLYDKHHLNHFSRTSLARLLSDASLQPEVQFNHYFPVRAIDLPGMGGLKATLMRGALGGLFCSGAMLRPMLQTIICRRS